MCFVPHTISHPGYRYRGFKSIFKASERGRSTFSEPLYLGGISFWVSAAMSAASEEVSDSGCPGKRKAPRRGFGWTKVRSGSKCGRGRVLRR